MTRPILTLSARGASEGEADQMQLLMLVAAIAALALSPVTATFEAGEAIPEARFVPAPPRDAAAAETRAESDAGARPERVAVLELNLARPAVLAGRGERRALTAEAPARRPYWRAFAYRNEQAVALDHRGVDISDTLGYRNRVMNKDLQAGFAAPMGRVDVSLTYMRREPGYTRPHYGMKDREDFAVLSITLRR